MWQSFGIAQATGNYGFRSTAVILQIYIRRLLFWLFWMNPCWNGENTLHLSQVAPSSSQHLSSSTFSPPHPFHPPGLCAHIMWSQKRHKHAQQSISWTQMKCHLKEHILLVHYVLQTEKAHEKSQCLSTWASKHPTRTASCGHFSWMGLLRVQS